MIIILRAGAGLGIMAVASLLGQLGRKVLGKPQALTAVDVFEGQTTVRLSHVIPRKTPALRFCREVGGDIIAKVVEVRGPTVRLDRELPFMPAGSIVKVLL